MLQSESSSLNRIWNRNSIVDFGPIHNPTTDLSWRLRFWSKFNNFLIIVDKIWNFIWLKSITFDLFSIKRAKKTVQMSIISSKKVNFKWKFQKRQDFWHFWSNLNHFRLHSNYFWYKLTFSIIFFSKFESSRRYRLNPAMISDRGANKTAWFHWPSFVKLILISLIKMFGECHHIESI